MQEWLSERLAVIGTKCNHLLCLDVVTGRRAEVPLPVTRTQTPTHSVANSASGVPSYGNCGIHAVSFSPDRRLMATGGYDPAHCQVFEIDLPDNNVTQARFRPAQTLMVSVLIDHHQSHITSHHLAQALTILQDIGSCNFNHKSSSMRDDALCLS